jgi:hypothetical protein
MKLLIYLGLVCLGLWLFGGCNDSAPQSTPFVSYFDKGQAPCFDASPRTVSAHYVTR